MTQSVDYLPPGVTNNILPPQMHPQMAHQIYQTSESLIQISYPPSLPPPPPPTSSITPNLPLPAQSQPHVILPVNHHNAQSYNQHQTVNAPYAEYRYDSARKDSPNEQVPKGGKTFTSTRYQKSFNSQRNMNSNRSNANNYNNHYNSYQQYQHQQNAYNHQIIYAHPSPNPNMMPKEHGHMHAPPEYRGDFNLDEAAYYVAKQWNNLKQPTPSSVGAYAPPQPPQPQHHHQQQQPLSSTQQQ